MEAWPSRPRNIFLLLGYFHPEPVAQTRVFNESAAFSLDYRPQSQKTTALPPHRQCQNTLGETQLIGG